MIKMRADIYAPMITIGFIYRLGSFMTMEGSRSVGFIVGANLPTGLFCSSGSRFRDPGNPHIDFRYLIPCGIVGDSCGGQIKDTLEGSYRIGRSGAVNSVRGDSGDGGVIAGDAVQLVLQLADLFPGGADSQIVSRPGGGNAGYAHRRVDIHVIAVVVPDNVNCRVPLIPQILGAPLA